MDFVFKVFLAAWHLLLDSSVYILFGLLISGLLRVFLSPHSVATHLGQGRFRSVFKAALLKGEPEVEEHCPWGVRA